MEKQGIGDSRQPLQRLGWIGAERFTAAIAAGADQGSPETAGQQPVQG
jgi:hypothetical protein